ncbi:HAD family phosphatase [Actinospica sp.]|jgi:HAD superfamily hydrolase (TIGR01509 family)|uniref:HAD family hydrolase n=1 Tax=Actinospica sp. TaxID=1872142 RepID=UPI002C4AA640|nr:HAD family phosphatase [Actinospica sp.]HWG28182.1 HAD family phosphatase [Actinospica sp.]
MPEPTAVLFDMDGTLIDSEPVWFDTEVRLLAEFDFELGREHWEHVLGQPNEVSCKYLVGVSGIPLTWEQLNVKIEAAMVEQLSQGLEMLPGAKELLVELQVAGVPTALVSASSRQIVDACLGAIGTDFFRHTVSGDDVDRGKPDPQPYLLAAELLGVDPADCVVIEDSPIGIAAGAAAGCRVLAVPHAAVTVPGRPRVTRAASLDGVDLAYLAALS